MITITNGKDFLKIESSNLIQLEESVYKIKRNEDYLTVDLLFIKEKNIFQKIVKVSDNSYDDIIDEYTNLNKKDNGLILINADDFNHICTLYDYMINKPDFEKDFIINIYGQILAYEFFVANYVTKRKETIKQIIDGTFKSTYKFEEYTQEIIDKGMDLLKNYIK